MACEQGRILLERERELAILSEGVEAATLGSGSVTVVAGPAGIGKTRLLGEVRSRASDAGIEVLSARAGVLERHFPFGMVRQLFEPRLASATVDEQRALLKGAAALAAPLVGMDPDGGSEPRAEDPAAVFRGLYWLSANLAARDPLLILLDDVQWGDESSLGWALYLSRRLERLPIMVVASLRLREPDVSLTALQLVTEPGTVLLQPEQLSEDAVATYVRRAYGNDPEPTFCGACHEATGGNPFLMEQLVTGLIDEGVESTADAAVRCRELVPEAIGRAVVMRLGRLRAGAAPLARSLAVLEATAQLRHAAALARLEEGAAREAADELVSAHILAPGRPIGFVHPIVREAIYAEIPPSERASAHLRSARLLSEDGAAEEVVAAHLLLADPAGDAWVLGALRDAARKALNRGAPEAAVRYLVRALHEPPPRAARVELLWELGLAQARGGHPAATDNLALARSLSEDPRERARIALALGRVLTLAGQGGEAIEVLESAIATLGEADRELALRVEADLNLAAWYAIPPRPAVTARLARLCDRVAGRRAGDPLLLANLAFQGLMAGEPADQVASLAERALADGRLLAEEGAESPMFHLAAGVLALTDRLALAESAYQQALDDARRRGSAIGFTISCGWRGHNSLLRGAISEAEADARLSLEVAREHGWELGTPFALACLVEALIERGDTATAEAVLAEHDPRERLPESLMFQSLLHARGRLRLAQGNIKGGLRDLLECGARYEQWGIRALGMAPWRVSAAPALAACRDRDRALRLARGEVSLARRFGSPRRLAGALRAQALVEGGKPAAELLAEALTTLAGSGAALERVRTLSALGTSLRHLGLREEARAALREALDLAHRSGASMLAEQAREELVATGARPRRAAHTGVEALTPSERRVAALAAGGLSNPAIAQSLFVTLRTVEMHLSNAYRKLGIQSRDDLPADLAPSHLPGAG